jgi:hypothetical protein
MQSAKHKWQIPFHLFSILFPTEIVTIEVSKGGETGTNGAAEVRRKVTKMESEKVKAPFPA